MNDRIIKESVFKLINEKFEIPINEIIGSSRFKEDIGADSLASIEFIMDLEDELDIMISDDIYSELITVNDLIKYIIKIK